MLGDILNLVLTKCEKIGWQRIGWGSLVLFFLWRMISLAMLFSLRPRNIKVEGKTILVGKWLSELDFIIYGADRLVEFSAKLGQGVWAMPALSCYQILVSSQQQIKEFATASEEVLSFRAAMTERLFFKQTMFGFELNDVDPHDAIPRRVAKILIRENLHQLGGIMKRRIEEVFVRLGRTEGKTVGGAVHMPVFDLSKMLIARMNNQLLFGDELADSDEFEKDSILYAWHTIVIMQLLRQIPFFMVSITAKILLWYSGAMYRVGSQVRNLVRRRLENRQQGPEKAHLDGTEWVIQSSTTPAQLAPQRIVQQMVALLFASMHQMQMACTWAIVDLCQYHELIEPLREEIRSVFSTNIKDPYEKLYLMDSFLRESSRLNPLDGLTVQRKAVKNFTFSNGMRIPAGNLVAVPQRVVMSDSERYTEPEKFNPYRYMKSRDNPDAAITKFTDVNWNYTFWGSPRKSCPGRWFASSALKHVLVHILMSYDVELVEPDAPKYLIWTTAIVPRSDMKVSFRPRKEEIKVSI